MTLRWLFLVALIAALAESSVSQTAATIAENEMTKETAGTEGNVRYLTPKWNWHQYPQDNLESPGTIEVHLAPCPTGIDTSNNPQKPFYVYIDLQGSPEAALVTGGSCRTGSSGGTIIITTVNAHSRGYMVGSAYAGIQEALNDCGSPGCGVVIPPTGANENALPIYATIYDQSNKSSLRGEGKPTLKCMTRSVCLFLGDRVDSNHFQDAVVSGLRFAPGYRFDGIPISQTGCSAGVATISLNNTGPNAVQPGDYVDINWTFNHHFLGIHRVASASPTQFTYQDSGCRAPKGITSQATRGFVSLENAAIEDNMAEATLRDLYLDHPGSYKTWGWWQNGIVIDNDQAFTLDGLNSDAIHCTTNYCGQVIYAPGPFRVNASVLWLSHLNIDLQCNGNGVTNWAGNTLHISDSVIEGFQQWGIFSGPLRGGYGGTLLDDVYEEASTICKNPLYGLAAQAGLVNAGGVVSVHGGEGPQGALPKFSRQQADSGTRYNYCFVVHDSLARISRCVPIGYAFVDASTPPAEIKILWPRVQGAGEVTYDVLRYTGSIAPYDGNCSGGSAKACGSVASGIAQCSEILCSLSDAANAPTANYAVKSPNYAPAIFWLAGGIVSLNSEATSAALSTPVFLDDTKEFSIDSPLIAEETKVPQFFAQRCGSVEAGEWISCLAGNSNSNNALPAATVLQAFTATGGTTGGAKGRIVFSVNSQSGDLPGDGGEIVSLMDCNSAKTFATPGNRPSADACDTYLGFEPGGLPPSQAQLAIGPLWLSTNTSILLRTVRPTKSGSLQAVRPLPFRSAMDLGRVPQ